MEHDLQDFLIGLFHTFFGQFANIADGFIGIVTDQAFTAGYADIVQAEHDCPAGGVAGCGDFQGAAVAGAITYHTDMVTGHVRNGILYVLEFASQEPDHASSSSHSGRAAGAERGEFGKEAVNVNGRHMRHGKGPDELFLA